MGRSLSHLSRGLLGIAFVGSLGFGATQALASPQLARSLACNPADPGAHDLCDAYCRSEFFSGGWCDPVGKCTCWHVSSGPGNPGGARGR